MIAASYMFEIKGAGSGSHQSLAHITAERADGTHGRGYLLDVESKIFITIGIFLYALNSQISRLGNAAGPYYHRGDKTKELFLTTHDVAHMLK